MPGPASIRKSVNESFANAKKKKSSKYANYEDVLLLDHVLPKTNQFLIEHIGLDEQQAREALLTEKQEHCDEISSNSSLIDSERSNMLRALSYSPVN